MLVCCDSRRRIHPMVIWQVELMICCLFSRLKLVDISVQIVLLKHTITAVNCVLARRFLSCASDLLLDLYNNNNSSSPLSPCSEALLSIELFCEPSRDSSLEVFHEIRFLHVSCNEDLASVWCIWLEVRSYRARSKRVCVAV